MYLLDKSLQESGSKLDFDLDLMIKNSDRVNVLVRLSLPPGEVNLTRLK